MLDDGMVFNVRSSNQHLFNTTTPKQCCSINNRCLGITLMADVCE